MFSDVIDLTDGFFSSYFLSLYFFRKLSNKLLALLSFSDRTYSIIWTSLSSLFLGRLSPYMIEGLGYDTSQKPTDIVVFLSETSGSL